ncbi:hypothetical protein J2T13_001165 [Paenibacillus sp. DS2015]|uniref:HRDC domain-containing protein n=1 Tax=Paenibacillus sp. DS2015 TaxID=3373917 RepID=UPI003D21D9A6
MQIVFMNRLVKGLGNNEILAAQVWIGEEEGVWHLGWRDLLLNDEINDSVWYEGGAWNEMLCIYRHGLSMKLVEGYRPLIEGVFHEDEELRGKGNTVQKLYCYSELHFQEDLYAQLSTWRRKRAVSEHKAPYFIASNKVLRLISTFIPHNAEELLQLPGVGVNKVEEYGADILEITSSLERNHCFPLDWVYTSLSEEAYMSWVFKQKEQKYKDELDKYRMHHKLLQGISERKNLDELSQDCNMKRKELIEALEELEKEGYSTETLIEMELQGMNNEEQVAVWSAFEELGDIFLKPVLLRVYGTEKESVKVGNIDQLYERIRMIRIRFRRMLDSRRNVS